MLLDEATASLDVENETKVQEALSRLLAGKTVIVIAHRMRTVENADKIVVLRDGVVAEQGGRPSCLRPVASSLAWWRCSARATPGRCSVRVGGAGPHWPRPFLLRASFCVPLAPRATFYVSLALRAMIYVLPGL